MFSNIKVLLWDVDGTLANSEKLMPAIHDGQKRVIAHELHVDIEEANRLWLSQKKNFSSTTQLTAYLIQKDPVETGILIENIAEKWRVTPNDPRLVSMFTRLSRFTHYICGNGTVHGITEQLKALGLDPSIFIDIVGLDIARKPKPDTAMFQIVLSKTGLPPHAHLMIGDRVDVDIVPAKSLGIRTCLIGPKQDDADICIKSIYEVEGLFFSKKRQS